MCAIGLLIITVTICEPIKNIYLYFFVGTLLLTIIWGIKRHKVTKKNISVYICWLFMFLLPRITSDIIFIKDFAILKYEVYIIVMLLISTVSVDNAFIVKMVVTIESIHILATYFFLLVPQSIYQAFAMYVYRKYPIGTDNGMKGYTAGICSHYSANALYISIAVIAIGALLLSGNYKSKGRTQALFIISFVSLLLTEKRAHLLFSSLVLFILYYKINKRALSKIFNKLFQIILLFVPALIISLILSPKIFFVFSRFAEIFSGKDFSTGRFGLWKSSIELFLENPLGGIGWQQFMKVADAYFNVHNTYLQIACETGIIGLVIFIISISLNYSSANYFMKNRKYENLCNGMKSSVLFSVGVQLFFILYCLTGNCLYDNTFFFYAIASGMGLSLQHNRMLNLKVVNGVKS